jgi:hypothetical protein
MQNDRKKILWYKAKMKKGAVLFLLAMVILTFCTWTSSTEQFERGTKKTNTNISFYGQNKKDDNGKGQTGVNLFKYPVTWNGKKIYPIAVPPHAFSKYAYKVMRITGTGMNPFYGHVVDKCGSGDCSKNIKANGYNFVVDLHKTGFVAAGKSDGVYKGTFEVVGAHEASRLPKGANMWKSQYIYCHSKAGEKKGQLVWVKNTDVAKKCK